MKYLIRKKRHDNLLFDKQGYVYRYIIYLYLTQAELNKLNTAFISYVNENKRVLYTLKCHNIHIDYFNSIIFQKGLIFCFDSMLKFVLEHFNIPYKQNYIGYNFALKINIQNNN